MKVLIAYPFAEALPSDDYSVYAPGLAQQDEAKGYEVKVYSPSLADRRKGYEAVKAPYLMRRKISFTAPEQMRVGLWQPPYWQHSSRLSSIKTRK